jgi:transitional endoplasmic reticulum ATPase
MGEASPLVAPDTAGFNGVYEDYKQHFSAPSSSSELVMYEILRKNHPNYHVTVTWPIKCDLLGYATAGHATAAMERSETYNGLRTYHEQGSRLEKKPGSVRDQVRFARWRYTWKEIKFLLYKLVLNEPLRPATEYFFILAPRSAGTVQDGVSSATDELLLAVGTWNAEVHKEIYIFDEGKWSKSQELWKSVQGCTWDEVILDSKMKANLIEDVHGFFDNQELYKKLSVPWKRGIILHGVPGNGKTISIKAFINTLATRPDPIPSLYVKSFDACQGSKFAIRSIFRHARTMAPCLLILEDLDSLVTEGTRSYFLNEVDGLETNDGILMIGSTNNLEALDPAIAKRPSRFDRKYHFHLPREEERVAYCRFWKQKLEGSDIVEFPDELCPIIAKMTEGFSFAYLKELFVWALLTVARGGTVEEDEDVSGKDILHAADTSSTSSTDGAVIIEHEQDTSQVSKETVISAVGEANKDDQIPVEAVKKERVVPEVDIPTALQGNMLLRIIRSQIVMLHEEMDSTKDAKVHKGGLRIGGEPPLVRQQQAEMVRAMRCG